jgi:hypothetical protein
MGPAFHGFDLGHELREYHTSLHDRYRRGPACSRALAASAPVRYSIV